MKVFINILSSQLPVLILIVVFGCLFFFRLDYQTLSSWDEAWYGSIAQEIVKTGDYMNLKFNGQPYYDHPPFGFWLMATSIKMFGANEFSVRFASAFLSVGSAILLYWFAYLLFNKKIIGFAAAIILNSCVWYVLRARSGNLDAVFLFFYLLTLLTAYLSTKKFRWFIVCAFSFGALILTKTIIGASSLLLIAWLLLPHIPKLIKDKKNWLILVIGVGLAYAIITPWYKYNLKTYPEFYQHHIVHIGMRDREFGQQVTTKLQWELPMFYLHMGVRKWYKIWQIAFVVLTFKVILDFFSFKKKILQLHKSLFLLLWNIVILYPFLTTDQTHIWHLIPVYAPLALVIAYGMYHLGILGLNLLKKPKLIDRLYLLPFIIIAIVQFKIFYPEVIPTSKYEVDEVAILKKAKNYKGQIYIDRDYIPIAVFYTDRIVMEHTRESDDVGTIKRVFDNSDNAILVIRNGIVDNYQKAQLPYKLKAKNNSFSIIIEN